MLARWLQEKKFGKQIKKIAWGKYMFGNMKLTVRDINGCLMVRSKLYLEFCIPDKDSWRWVDETRRFHKEKSTPLIIKV